ncbi:MAG: retroviral-like aspartic protease family protein, partial [Thiohalomonadales bacterium]
MHRLIRYGLFFILGWAGSWAYFYNAKEISPIVDSSLEKEIVSPTKSKMPTELRPKSSPRQARSPLDNATLLLDEYRYKDFISVYISVRETADDDTVATYQNLLLQTVRALSQAQNYKSAFRLLNLYLNYEYDNIVALLLLAELHHRQKHYLASIDALYRARSYAHQSQDIDDVNAKLRTMVTEQAERLKSQGDKLALLDFYRRLTQLEPDYAPNFIGVAEAQIGLGNPEDARIALSMARHDPSVSAQIDLLLDRINQAPAIDLAGATAVGLLRANDQFLIDVIINKQQSARLLLDTGASISIISPEIANALGLTSVPTHRIGWFSTANGVVSSSIYQLQSLSVENYQTNN